MADFESIVRNHAGEDGSIHADAIAKLVKAISTTVGNEFVEKSRYKAKLEEIDTLKGEKQTAEDSATTAEKWKTKYNALKDDFENYKKDQAEKETSAAKEKAFRAILKTANVREKRFDSVVRLAKADGIIDSIELDENGAAKNADKLVESMKTDYEEYIEYTTTEGAKIAHPPARTTGGEENKPNSRAAQIAAAYHNSLYGEMKKE